MKRLLRIIAMLVLIAMMPISLIACNTNETTEDETKNETEKVTEKMNGNDDKKNDTKNDDNGDEKGDEGEITSDGLRKVDLSYNFRKVKMLGRSSVSDGGIICDHSASGIEFTGTMKGDVYVDVVTSTVKSGCNTTYFTVYIDGERQEKRFSVEAGNGELYVANFKEEGEHTIRVVKQTESNYTLCMMQYIRLDGKLGTAPKQNDLYIEFIGDSLTCGMGNIGDNSSSDPQTPEWEDATQSYAYMIAEELGADYSIIAQSGIGIAGGWSNYPMADYYAAHSYTRDKDIEQDFSRVPDAVVINLGTNDYFINQDKSSDECKPEDVERMTEELILLVRECYGTDVPILWVQGMVGVFVRDRIEAAIDKLGGEDEGIYTYFDLPQNTGGAQGHPTVEGHTAATNAILPIIKNLLDIQ